MWQCVLTLHINKLARLCSCYQIVSWISHKQLYEEKTWERRVAPNETILTQTQKSKETEIHPEPTIWGTITQNGISKGFRDDNFGTHNDTATWRSQRQHNTIQLYRMESGAKFWFQRHSIIKAECSFLIQPCIQQRDICYFYFQQWRKAEIAGEMACGYQKWMMRVQGPGREAEVVRINTDRWTKTFINRTWVESDIFLCFTFNSVAL